jgi:PleD family two-component response regulator
VAAESDGEGTGSQFIVRLPRLISGGDVQVSESTAQLLSSQLKILVADDNEDAAEMPVEFLQMMGNTVQQAHDGLEAVARAAASQPDVIVMDIGMPKLKRYEACRRIVKSRGASTWS